MDSLEQNAIYEETKKTINTLYTTNDKINKNTLAALKQKLTPENAKSVSSEISKLLQTMHNEDQSKIMSITGPTIKLSIMVIAFSGLSYFLINYLKTKFCIKNRFLDLVGRISGNTVLPSVCVLLLSIVCHYDINF